MKNHSALLWTCIGVLCITACGRKGDPVLPPVPKLTPVQDVSATVSNDAIVLSWMMPDVYTTGKPLDLRRDIDTITVSRKQISSTDTDWDFTLSRDGWQAVGETLPLKWYQRTLRTASKGAVAFLTSPDGLALSALEYPYIRLKLWTKHADRAYIAFTTTEDTQWDLDLALRFQPAVHTSFWSYQRVFAARKLKAFPLRPLRNGEDRANEYMVDMREVPAWKGTIQQLGVLVATEATEAGRLELGVEQVELLESPDPPAPLYLAPPWLFLDDAEGWQALSPATLSGAAEGAFYVQSDAGPILAASAPGQQSAWQQGRQLQIRMKSLAGTQAYIILKSARDRPLEKWPLADLNATSSNVFPFSLRRSSDFEVYTIPLPDTAKSFSQIGLFFPPEPGVTTQQVLIDYIALLDADDTVGTTVPTLLQKEIPTLVEVAALVRQQQTARAPRYDLSYEALPDNGELFRDAPVTLVSVSPEEPEPLEIDETGRVTFRDTASFRGDGEERGFPFRRGERYTYSIHLIDRKGRTTEQPRTVTVNFAAIPRAPLDVRTTATDRAVQLTWDRPFLDTSGAKLRTFDGYHVYRTTLSGQYTGLPLHQAPVENTSFLDTAVVNGVTYYYVVQSVAAVTEGVVVGGVSTEVSATPSDSEAPPVPVNLTSAYVADTVKLFWNFSASPDWKGFHVYRSDSPDGPFQQLTSRPVQQPGYDDLTAVPLRTYYYYVTSIDQAVPPNESQPSNIIHVTPGRR